MMGKRSTLALLLISLVLFSCGKEPEIVGDPAITLNEVASEIDIHTDIQREFLNEEDPDNIKYYASGTAELSRPNSVKLSFKSNANFSKYEVMVSESEDFDNYYSYDIVSKSIETYNYKVGTRYFWKVKGNYRGADIYSETSSFYIKSEGPRNLYVSGVTNCRDLGGYDVSGLYKTTIKQGLIYRTGRLNHSGASAVAKLITDNGIDTMLEQLGVKTEIDLRTVDDNEVGGLTTESVLGESVSYYQCPMVFPFAEELHSNTYASVRKIFSILSNKDNYPVFFHCHIGTDRTGIIAYLIHSVLGADLEVMDVDYVFSNFGNIGGSRKMENIAAYRGQINPRGEGFTQSDAINFLVDEVGVPEKQIKSLQEIMLNL